MRWSELSGNVWTLPASRSKSKRANSIPLPSQAMAVLAAQRRGKPDDYVFSTTGGRLPSSDYSKRKRLLDAASGLDRGSPWHLHDLRRAV
jgi:integrase